jgi:hypothetical protein
VAEEAFDIATFEPPAGWERVASPGVLAFRAATGDAQIALFPSVPSKASPAENFAAEWARLVTAPLGRVDAPQLTTQPSPDGWTGVIGAANVTRDGATFMVLQVTVTGFGRAMSVVAHIANPARAREVTEFFDRIKFRTEVRPGAPAIPAIEPGKPRGEPPAAPARANALTIAPAGVVNGEPVGLFYRLSVGIGSGRRIELDTRLFLPGRRITRAFPFGGGDAFDASRCNPDTCGTFALDGGAVIVRWDNGATDRWAFAPSPGGISLGGSAFRAARPVPGPVLVGSWSGGQSIGSSLSNVYRFANDGTFWFGSGQTGLSGRYRVEGLTLILNFADGSESRRTLFAAGTTEPIGLIAVDGSVYARE